MTWAEMCLDDRWTDSLGRSGVPATFTRTRLWRRRRRAAVSASVMSVPDGGKNEVTCESCFSCLSCLAQDPLSGIPHSLALIGLGLSDAANVGGHLAHQLLVDALYQDPRGDWDLERDAFGCLHVHRVAESQGQL